jgi:hypothetical protein
VALIEITYPGNLLEFYKLVVKLTEVDMFDGPGWYEKIFKFRFTNAFSENFDTFGMGDMNFFMNSASLPIIVAFMIASVLFWHILSFIARRCYKSACCRKLGIYADSHA